MSQVGLLMSMECFQMFLMISILIQERLKKLPLFQLYFNPGLGFILRFLTSKKVMTLVMENVQKSMGFSHTFVYQKSRIPYKYKKPLSMYFIIGHSRRKKTSAQNRK